MKGRCIGKLVSFVFFSFSKKEMAFSTQPLPLFVLQPYYPANIMTTSTASVQPAFQATQPPQLPQQPSTASVLQEHASADILLAPHRQLWRMMSRTITLEIIRLRMEFPHHQRNYSLCHYLGQKLLAADTATMFNDFLPYINLNASLTPRRDLAEMHHPLAFSGAQLDVLTKVDKRALTGAFLPENLPDSLAGELFNLINSFTDMIVDLRHSANGPPSYYDNKLFAASESLRRLLHYLICTAVTMVNIDQVLHLGFAFPYKLLKFLLTQLHRRELYVDHHHVVTMQAYATNTHNFEIYVGHMAQRMNPHYVPRAKLVPYSHTFNYYITQETFTRTTNFCTQLNSEMWKTVDFILGPGMMFSFFSNAAKIPADLHASDANASNELRGYMEMNALPLKPILKKKVAFRCDADDLERKRELE